MSKRKITNWAQWAVGIAGCTKSATIGRFKRGNLVCKKCGSADQIQLFEGGVCKRCHKPKKINPDYLAKKLVPRSGPPQQLDETIAVKNLVGQTMQERGITARYLFARLVGVDRSGFNHWYLGNYAEQGQKRINGLILEGLKKLKAAEVAA